MMVLLPRVLALLIFGILGILSYSKHQALRHPFALLILTQLLFVILSSLLVEDEMHYKLLGPRYRYDGLLYQIGLALLALFIYKVVLQLPKLSSKILLWGLFIAASLEALYVTLERFNIRLLGYQQLDIPMNRINGSLGHPGMVAGLLVVGLLVAFWLIWNSHNKLKLIVALGFVLLAMALGITNNRTSYLALLGVLPFILLIRRNFVTLAMIFVAALLPYFSKNILPNNLGFDRQYSDTSTLDTRLAFWKLSLTRVLPTISGMPLIGGGPDALVLALIRDLPPEDYLNALALERGWPEGKIENYTVIEGEGSSRDKALNIYFSDAIDKSKGQLFFYYLDKAHNFFIDRLLAYGPINAFIWLILYAFPILMGLFSKNKDLKLLAICLMCISIYYLAWFPVISVEPYHVALMAIAWALWQSERKNSSVRPAST